MLHGDYTPVYFNFYRTGETVVGIYGEYVQVPHYKCFISHGEVIKGNEPDYSFDPAVVSYDEFGEYFDF